MGESVSLHPGHGSLDDALARWVVHGLISDAQARGIRAFETASAPATVPVPRSGEQPDARSSEAAPSRPVRRNQLAVEALAYVGGALALAAIALLVGLNWGDLSLTSRLALPCAASLVLLTAGFLGGRGHDRSSPLTRFRSAMWLAGTASWAAFLAVLGAQAFDLSPEHTWLLIGVASLALAGPLYQQQRGALQQLGLLVTALVTAGALGAQVAWDEPTWTGMAMWLVALAWLAAGERRLLHPAVVARYGAAVALASAAQVMTQSVPGQLLIFGTLALLFALGVRWDSLGLLAIAAVATMELVPQAMVFFFPDHERLVAPVGLLVVGGVLVGSAVVVTRRRGSRAEGEDEPVDRRPG